MVRQNVNQLALVFGLQQTLECCLGELGKRRIGRGENGEGALALQRSNQVTRFQRSHKRRQVTTALSELDNVFAWPRSCCGGGRWRHEHCVDDVHHAVRGRDVGRNDLRVAVDEDTGRRGRNQHVIDLQRLRVLRRLQVLAEHSRTRHNMVRQNANQLVLVFGLQQTRECCLGELGKRRIGRGENGEGALALQRSNQVARFQRSHERRQVTAALSELDNVFAWPRNCCRCCGGDCASSGGGRGGRGGGGCGGGGRGGGSGGGRRGRWRHEHCVDDVHH